MNPIFCLRVMTVGRCSSLTLRDAAVLILSCAALVACQPDNAVEPASRAPAPVEEVVVTIPPLPANPPFAIERKYEKTAYKSGMVLRYYFPRGGRGFDISGHQLVTKGEEAEAVDAVLALLGLPLLTDRTFKHDPRGNAYEFYNYPLGLLGADFGWARIGSDGHTYVAGISIYPAVQLRLAEAE